MTYGKIQDDGVKLVRTTSALDCGGRCPLRMYVKDGVITRVETDDYEDTDKQLRACWRGRAYRHWIHHNDRLLYPMKRAGETLIMPRPMHYASRKEITRSNLVLKLFAFIN